MATAYEVDEEYDLNTELLPCEFCEELFPMDVLIEHTSGCEPALCKVTKRIGSSEEEEYYEVDDDDEDDDDPFAKGEVSGHLAKLDIEEKQENNTKSKPVVKSLSKNTNSSPIKISSNQVYNIITTDVNETNPIVKDTTLQKNISRAILNSATKGENNTLGPSSSKNIQNNCNEIVMPEDEGAISSDDDDNYETIENFWRRAAIVLKKRLAGKGDTKITKKVNIPVSRWD